MPIAQGASVPRGNARLPSRNGVGASCIVLPPGPWPRLIDFLAERFPSLSVDEIVARMQRGDLFDSQGAALSPQQLYRPQQKLYYYRHVDDEARIPFEAEVLFQDDYLVAVDKPHFLPVSPVGHYVQETLLVRLKRSLGIDTLAPMHRLDRETAGVMIFTVQPEVRGRYQTLFADGAVSKTYEAIAAFRFDLPLPLDYRSRLEPDTHFMRMREAEGTTNAHTRIELIERRGTQGHYRLHPATGRKHQLRVQMAALGLPIVNDAIYPEFRADQVDYSRPLQLLARRIAFRDPLTGALREFISRRQLAGAFGP